MNKHQINYWIYKHSDRIRPLNYVLLACSLFLLACGAVRGRVYFIRYAVDLPVSSWDVFAVLADGTIGLILYMIFRYIYIRLK